MPSFEINPNAKKGSERDKKLQNRADAGGVEGRTAAKMLQKKGLDLPCLDALKT